jgi:hypothetical protein
MPNIKFHKPVIVQPGRIDRERVVVSVKDAATVLLRDWPRASHKREKAMLACLDVIKGMKPPSHARRAFISAAKDARILLNDFAQ